MPPNRSALDGHGPPRRTLGALPVTGDQPLAKGVRSAYLAGMSLRLAALALLLSLTACKTTAPAAAPTPTTQGPAGAHEAISQVHIDRCSNCHQRVEPGQRSRSTLQAALARHRKRVRLTDEQWTAMLDYLAAP